MNRIKFYIFVFPKEKLNKKLIYFMRKYKIKFCILNFGKKIKNKKVINYKSKDIKELFIRILNQKEELCFFLYNEFDSYKDIFYLIKKSKWFFGKYNEKAGMLDFNLNLSKYYHFYDKSFSCYNKFYGLNEVRCVDPRCFVFKKQIIDSFLNFYIDTKCFGHGLEIFLSFFCYSKKLMVCRDISRKIFLKNNLSKFNTYLKIDERNNFHYLVKKFNVFMENISNIVYFNYETNQDSFFNQGPRKLIKLLKPILKKK